MHKYLQSIYYKETNYMLIHNKYHNFYSRLENLNQAFQNQIFKKKIFLTNQL